MSDILKESGILQDKYDELIQNRALTKKAICDLCVPFRDKYKLTDLQTLQIARRELKISEIYELRQEDVHE